MWALNIPAMRIILILQACQLYHTSFYSGELSFFMLAPQTPALGDEQAKCIFNFLDTLCVPYAEFKQHFFLPSFSVVNVMSFWLLLQWKGSAFMSIKCSKIAACCPVITVLLASSALTSWSHWHPLLTFLQEFPSDIFCNFLFRFARQVPQ